MKKKKIILFAAIVGIILFATLFIVLQQKYVKNIFLDNPIKSTNTSWLPNPTKYPPIKATMWAGAQQTQLAAELLPTPNAQNIYPRLQEIIIKEVLAQKLDGTLAGYGILSELDPPIVIETIDGHKVNIYNLDSLNWYEETYESFVSVWSGVSYVNPGKGIIYIVYMPHFNSYQGFFGFENPNSTGKLLIIGAQGERLILQSEFGGLVYFDIPALSYVNSLDERVSPQGLMETITPTENNETKDDASNYPIEVSDYSSTNSDLNYFINYTNDYDWFLFYSLVPGKITISLTRSPGDCEIRIVKLGTKQNGDKGEIIGENISGGSGKKDVVIPYAQPSDYEVRVWCPDGSFSSTKPYTLRIDVPKPEKVTPILECVTENSDGTFIAHFGYNNPNQYMVNVNADNDNSFHPGPVFRTGQPELFAPGRVVDYFSVLFDGNGLTWTLDGGAVTVNRNSARCP